MPTEIDPSDRLSDGWEPAPLPARTPDDPMPSSPKMPAPSVAPPTLCELGPCAHYHKAVLRFDAATPMDGSASVTHTQNLRSCYPTAGISIELEDSPVFECSRWAPIDNVFKIRLEGLRNAALRSADGDQYKRELAEWRADQQRIRDEIAQFSETPHPELGKLASVIAEMESGDRLELRPKGKLRLLATLTWGNIKLGNKGDLGEPFGDDLAGEVLNNLVTFTDEGLAAAFVPGDYQLRVVNSRAQIVSTRIHTIPAPQTTETPKP